MKICTETFQMKKILTSTANRSLPEPLCGLNLSGRETQTRRHSAPPPSPLGSGYNSSPPLNDFWQPLISGHTCVWHPRRGRLSVSLFTTVVVTLCCLMSEDNTSLNLDTSALKSNSKWTSLTFELEVGWWNVKDLCHILSRALVLKVFGGAERSSVNHIIGTNQITVQH